MQAARLCSLLTKRSNSPKYVEQQDFENLVGGFKLLIALEEIQVNSILQKKTVHSVTVDLWQYQPSQEYLRADMYTYTCTWILHNALVCL